MSSFSDLNLFSVQLVAFTPEKAGIRTNAILRSILSTLGDRFDGDVSTGPELVLPIDIVAQSAVPVVSQQGIRIKSACGAWRFEANAERVDSCWTSQAAGETLSLPEIVRQCAEPIHLFPLGENDIRVGRIAVVVRRYMPQSDNASVELASQFCRQELVNSARIDAPFRNSRGFEIHNLKTYLFPGGGYLVNSWARCRSTVPLHGAPVISFEQDLNTRAEDAGDRSFDREGIDLFFDWAQKEIDSISRLYFPE